MEPRRTPRLLLREVVRADAPALHREVYADPDVVRMFSAYGVLDLPAVERLVAGSVWQWSREPFGRYAVERAEDGRLLGQVQLTPWVCPPEWQLPAHDGATPEVEVAVAFGRDHWGRGYAAEAVGSLLDKALLELRLDQVVALPYRANTRSVALHRRLGFTVSDLPDAPHDVRCEITRAAWEARRQGGPGDLGGR